MIVAMLVMLSILLVILGGMLLFLYNISGKIYWTIIMSMLILIIAMGFYYHNHNTDQQCLSKIAEDYCISHNFSDINLVSSDLLSFTCVKDRVISTSMLFTNDERNKCSDLRIC